MITSLMLNLCQANYLNNPERLNNHKSQIVFVFKKLYSPEGGDKTLITEG